MRKTILLFYAIIFIQGCATMPQIIQKTPVLPRSVKVDINVGVQQKVNVGDTMITKAIYSTYPGFIAKKDYTNPQPGFPQIVKDASYVCMGKIPTGEYVCDLQLTDSYMNLRQNFSNSVNNSHLQLIGAYMNLPSIVINNAGDLVGWYQLGYYLPLDVSENGVFQEAEIMSISASGFKRELIFNGKTKDSIKILYREFSGDMARPAFYQELMYDLSESKIIGFKDIKILVIESTNVYIKYEVLASEGQSATME